MAIWTSRVHPPSTQGDEVGSRSWGAALAVAAFGLVVAATVTAVVAVDPRRTAAIRDVMAISTAGDDMPYYAAWGTYTGVLAWTASAAVLLIAARFVTESARETTALLVGGGAMALVLAVDDLYMLHDAFLLQRGVDERITQGVIALMGLIWVLWCARRLLVHPETPVLLVSVIFLAHSAVSDAAGDLLLHEEGTKLASALCWAVWAYRTVLRELWSRSAPDGPPRPARA